MKSNTIKLIKLGFIFLIYSQSKAQDTASFILNAELIKKVSVNFDNIGVFLVNKMEIDYHTADTSATSKRNYRNALNSLKEYEKFKDYDKSFQQKRYNELIIEINNLKQVIANEVKYDTIKKRSTFILVDSSINVNTLSGEFIELPQKYMVAISAIENKFIKNELSNDLRENYSVSYEKLSKSYPLIQKVGTDEYYFIMSDEFINAINIELSNKELLNIIHSLGYKEYKDDYGDLFIKTKTCEIKLDVFLYKLIKKNPNWISELDNDQTQIANLIKQTIPQSKLLDKYLSTYNITKNKMPLSELNAWRTATKNAIELNDQIYKLNKKYHSCMNSFTLLYKSNNLDIFSDNLLASKGVLGL